MPTLKTFDLSKKSLTYVYPIWQKGSFSKIAKYHIKYLREHYRVHEIDIEMLNSTLMWSSKKDIIIHPMFYPILGAPEKPNPDFLNILGKLIINANHLIGFDTADSDRISLNAVVVANNFDLIIVPSHFAYHSYRRSGVKVKIHIVPHGVDDIYNRKERVPRNVTLYRLYNLKNSRKYVYVLFNLLHSGYRKGADLVFKCMKEIQRTHSNVILIVKRGNLIDPMMNLLKKLRMIEVAGWLSEDDLVDLYDLCDIVVVPSRGGGFELNSLEALARGKIVLVPDDGCFKDYIGFCIPIKIKSRPFVLKGNNVHVGRGHEIDVNDFINKLHIVLNDLDNYKRLFDLRKNAIRKRYSWKVICDRIISIFKDMGL